MTVRVYGIRHHGPGSARTLRAALEAYEPDCVLVEGPSDVVDPLSYVGRAELEPPVALLVYDVERPKNASFYPFAAFSPEWIALTWADSRKVTARFFDLPQAHDLAMRADPETLEKEPIREDPMGELARAAGYSDSEQWWNDVFEERRGPDAEETFAAVMEAMAALRANHAEKPRELVREAWMRKVLRGAVKEGFQRIAVVCGAWHAPVLVDMPTVKDDAERLKNLPKTKVSSTWVPWTYSRLGWWSGYGAGVESPGWYDHLWQTERAEEVAPRWLTKVARLLRDEDLDAPPASVVEAQRLAEALAAIRNTPRVGYSELEEASRTVFCFGSDRPLEVVREKLVVGERMGKVPDDVPVVPLAADLRAHQKRLRLAPTADEKRVDLDLRKENDLEKSRLLHRLAILGIDWGERDDTSHLRSTFHEIWALRWRPELELGLVEAAPLGNTVFDAASARARLRARESKSLEELSALLDAVLLADVSPAMEAVLQALQGRAASGPDVQELMHALPPLVRIVRYGDVRGTDATVVRRVLEDVLARITASLPNAVSSLDDDAAGEVAKLFASTQTALVALQDAAQLDSWSAVLAKIAERDDVHGLVAGRAARLLRDADRSTPEDSARRISVALSAGQAVERAAAWFEGFFSGAGALLVHDEKLWALIDGWLAEVPAERFVEVLPVLRRTFATFEAGERRRLGEKARAKSGGAVAKPEITSEFDGLAAREAVATVLAIFGAEVRS